MRHADQMPGGLGVVAGGPPAGGVEEGSEVVVTSSGLPSVWRL